MRGLAMLACAVVTGFGLLASASPAVADAPQGTIEGAGDPGAIRGRYIVLLKDGDAAADGLVERFGGVVRREFHDSVHGFVAQLTEPAAKRLAADPRVESVEQDRRVAMTGVQADPPSWGLDRIDQVNQPLSGTYTYASDASNVTAYVLDTGVRLSHVDFGGRARSGYDFVDDDADASDCNGHGTHVAGTIGGSSFGVAKGVQLVAVRVLDCDGYGSYSGIIAGIEWVTAHAVRPAVANLSLGGSPSDAVDQAVRAAVASGITFAVAAGNSAADACGSSPARTPEAITVGATDSADQRASFSNFGSCLDIYAPGVGITSASAASDNGAAVMSGTSMASPHVAGAAALVLAGHPGFTPAQVQSALVNGVVVTSDGGQAVHLLYTAAPVTVVAPPPVVAVAPPPPCNVGTNDGNVDIRDRGTATSAIVISGCAGKAARSARVEVHLVHPRRGDLVVELVAPNGSAKRLKAANKRDGGANVDAAWTVNLSARNKNGVWRLRVKDSYKGNVGFIDRWTLTV